MANTAPMKSYAKSPVKKFERSKADKERKGQREGSKAEKARDKKQLKKASARSR